MTEFRNDTTLINYRENTTEFQRQKFSNKVRSKGIGQVPIVVDSVDKELSLLLATIKTSTSFYTKYGKEYIMNMDLSVKDFFHQINTDLKTQITGKNITMSLENGQIIDLNLTLGDVYKKHRDEHDHILYILITYKTSIYTYILSILRYFGRLS